MLVGWRVFQNKSKSYRSVGPRRITDITAARHEVPSIHALASPCFRPLLSFYLWTDELLLDNPHYLRLQIYCPEHLATSECSSVLEIYSTASFTPASPYLSESLCLRYSNCASLARSRPSLFTRRLILPFPPCIALSSFGVFQLPTQAVLASPTTFRVVCDHTTTTTTDTAAT